MFKLTIVILALCASATQAAVIRNSTETNSEVLETTTAGNEKLSTTLEPELTTVKEDDLTTSTTERFGVLSRDEEATILVVDQTLLDPAPAELIQAEAQAADLEKSGKLLLLSTPKIAEKPKQPEESEESEEENQSERNITEFAVETTTVGANNDETTTSKDEIDQGIKNVQETKEQIKSQENVNNPDEPHTTEDSVMDKITKLYPINDTLYSDNSKQPIETAPIVEDQPKESSNSNLASVILEELESDYVLVDLEVLEGSYIDVDSELHLQPIVQSVEIVPSSVDDSLLINYVQIL